MKGQNRVAHVSCSNDGDVCRKLPKTKARNSLSTLYITKDSVYGFTGPQTMDDVLNFLSAENFMNDEVLEEDFRRFAEAALGLSLPYSVKVRAMMENLS